MQKRNSLIEQQKLINALNNLATAYQEISVIKMKEARETINHSREYVDKLKQVFKSLTSSHSLDLSNQKIKKNLETAKVLITANSRFNGDILRKITDAFLKDKNNVHADIFIIGKMGQEYLNDANFNLKYTLIELPDSNINSEKLKFLLQKLNKYKNIYVYYAVFKTVLDQETIITQVPSIYTLLSSIKSEYNSKKDQNNAGKLYLFEPSGEEIANYLNNSVAMTLVRQTIYETELARNAARITAMTKLIDNTNQEKGKLKKQMFKLKREEYDKKQQERLTGISFWGKSI